MKKIISLVSLLVLILSLSACGAKFTCDYCGEESRGPKEVGGAKFCNECYEKYKDAVDALDDLTKDLGM